jgi:hypothetical protein
MEGLLSPTHLLVILLIVLMVFVVLRLIKSAGAPRQTAEPRVVRVDDFIADHLEKEANAIPPSAGERAAILREQARIFRQSISTARIRVSEGGGD